MTEELERINEHGGVNDKAKQACEELLADIKAGKLQPKEVNERILGTKTIKWNFTKFLVDRQGHVVERYAPNVEPESIVDDIEKLL